MIQFNPKVLPELEGCKGFGFNAKSNRKESSGFSYRSSIDRFEQNMALATAHVLAREFEVVPCDLSIKFGVENGHSFTQGDIYPYDQNAMRKVEDIIEKINILTCSFSQKFENSSFSITVTQSTIITKVYKYKPSYLN